MSQRTVMPYSATPPKPICTRSSKGSKNSFRSWMAWKGTWAPVASTPQISGSMGSTFRPSMPTTVWPSFIRKWAREKPAGPRPTTSTL